MSGFRFDALTRCRVSSVARSSVRRLRKPLTLDEARREVSEWCHSQHELTGEAMPSERQLNMAAQHAADEAADYARRSARLGRWA